jgi:hypothetical protein
MLALIGNECARAQSPGNETWIPDCSNPNNLARTNFHPIVNDNGGNPTLDPWYNNAAIETRRDDADRLYDQSFMAQPDAANGSMIVYETRRRNVEETATTASIIPEGRKIILKHVDSLGTTLSESVVDDGTTQVSLPKIVQGNGSYNNYYIVTYKSHSASGDNIVANWYYLNGTGGIVRLGSAVTMLATPLSYGIGEYAINHDGDYGVIIAVAAWEGTSYTYDCTGSDHWEDAIYSQWIDYTQTRQWTNQGRLTNVPDGHFVFNPIVNWSLINGNYTDIVWGQATISGSKIFIQTYGLPLSDSAYGAGGGGDQGWARSTRQDTCS